MRKNYFITAAVLILTAVSIAHAKVEMSPYYNYQFVEGVSVSPEGNLGFLVNLKNELGTIIKPFEKHSFIGFYSINYQGPGLKRQEGREFSERYLDHLFVARHHWAIRPNFILKTQYDIMLEARRSGSNENWQNGLYNFNRYGGNTSFTKILGEVELTPVFKYHFMSFPNYTDMLAEIRSGADPSASEGKQNHHIFEIGAKGKYRNNSFMINLAQLLYTKQKVAVDKVQPDGTFYSDKKQKDFIATINGSHTEELSERSVISPDLTFTYKNSNQNYQHFTELTSTSPVSFHEDYNDYMDISLALPFTLGLSQKWSFVLQPDFSYKRYMHREPRDESGTFLDGKKQSRFLGNYTAGFRNQIGESSSSMLFFTYQHQSSNMGFERYVLYNYSGFSTGFKFQVEY